ncbi:MAG: hypothetical protein OXC40_05240 [Proteobacteria bacterium]|nr:hypothetical protein [Pseudomonadota bacterium]
MLKRVNSNNLFALRARLKAVIREFFCHYTEVDTPVIVRCPGVERYMRYFATSWDDGGRKYPLWLRSSPELHMKRLIARGYSHIYQMGPCFRNSGEHLEWHHPEFWMLEWYQHPSSFKDMIETIESLLTHCFSQMSQDKHIHIERLSVYQCFSDFLGVTLMDHDPELPQQLAHAGVGSITENDDFESAYFKALLEVIEPKIEEVSDVVILYDYPPSQGVLAQLGAPGITTTDQNKTEQKRAKRAEAYVRGLEIANGCLELWQTSAHTKHENIINQARQKEGIECPAFDRHFLQATDHFPDNLSGVACGFDRLLGVITNQCLDSVIPFRDDTIYPPS